MNRYQCVLSNIYSVIYKNIDEYLTRKAKDGVGTAHVLDLVFPNERRVRSIIGGLETSMGTSTWEAIAKMLAPLGGYEVLDQGFFNENLMPEQTPESIEKIFLKYNNQTPFNFYDYKKEIKDDIEKNKYNINAFKKITKGKGIDIVLKKDNCIYLFDIKTNQINAGSGNNFCVSIKEWVAYTLLKYQTYDVKAYIAFPFDPHNGSFWKKEAGKILPLQQNVNALCEDEFWDLISGQNNTWSDIRDIFTKIGESDLIKKHNNLFHN